MRYESSLKLVSQNTSRCNVAVISSRQKWRSAQTGWKDVNDLSLSLSFFLSLFLSFSLSFSTFCFVWINQFSKLDFSAANSIKSKLLRRHVIRSSGSEARHSYIHCNRRPFPAYHFQPRFIYLYLISFLFNQGWLDCHHISIFFLLCRGLLLSSKSF